MIKQISKIKRGVVDLVSEEELTKKIKYKKFLRVKFGADPTAPDLHLGHTVILEKLRQFQEFGHKVIFIIGDFTARIGDPSGRISDRKPLSKEEIEKNALTYQRQVFKILQEDKTEIYFNSNWFDKMGLSDLLKLTSYVTVAQLIARADFKGRFAKGNDISILEFLYPLLQGYDSIQIKSDVEIGGTDQIFNLLLGRQLQKDFGQPPQVVITLPLLEGTDGIRKMSKSYGNYIALNDQPYEMFGKIMSISDELMYRYYELLTDRDLNEVKNIPPRDAKVSLAKKIVSKYWSKEKAEDAFFKFEKVFKKKELPAEMETVIIKESEINIVELLFKAKLVSSKSEAKRLISLGGVKINKKKVLNEKEKIILDKQLIVQVGKRKFKKVILKE